MPLTKCSECVFADWTSGQGGGGWSTVCKRHAPIGVACNRAPGMEDVLSPRWPQINSYQLRGDEIGCGDGERKETDAH